MNWEQFLDQHHINYVNSGPNTKRGEVSINCPFCGDDPSEHLGINLTTGYWGCWRNANHKGRKPEYLIKRLLGCSYEQARLLTQSHETADPETLDDAIKLLTGDDITIVQPSNPYHKTILKLPNEARKITANRETSKRFYEYIANRGFGRGTEEVCQLYGLHCCNTGSWKDRIIFPIYKNDQLVTWTARAIVPTIKAPRYKTLSEEQGAAENIKDICYLQDPLTDYKDPAPSVVFVTEGPFDALNLDFWGYNIDDARATCIFGTEMTFTQANIIAEIAGRCPVVMLFDPGTTEQLFASMDILKRYGVVAGELSNEIEDPGAMTYKQIEKLVEKYTKTQV